VISFDKFFDENPRVEYFPEYDPKGEHNGIRFEGIKALAYDGADYKGKHTKIFAHYGFPKNVKEPAPAVVLIHGGGGHPEDVWIKKWNDRGYAAIAMDTTGFFPTKPMPYLYEGYAEGLERRLVAPFAQEGYDVAPNTSRMGDVNLPLEDQWMYHAVLAVILAHNILRNDKRVDKRKIGICGISWGGVITAISIGFDPRFAFAIPIYGSGYLGCGHSDLCYEFKRPGVQKWFAENRFQRVKFPVMWLCWNDDCFFSVNSNSMSYQDTKQTNRNTCLSMLHQMRHSHGRAYTPNESYWFADEIIKGHQIPETEASYTADAVNYSCDAKVKAVRLFYIKGKLRYTKRTKHGIENASFMDQEWEFVELDPGKNKAALPCDAVGRYVEFTLENGIVLTTPYMD